MIGQQMRTNDGLRRNLKNRHLQLIAIGGAIGSGLFMGSGKIISIAGPSVILAYLLIGFMLFFVMRALGELLLSNLQYKSFIDFVYEYLGPFAGYITGWTYWFCWIVTGTVCVIAATGYLQFWWPLLPIWIPGVVSIALIMFLNLLSVRWFGELDFWFGLIKVVAITALVISAVILIMVHYVSPAGNLATWSNLWNLGMFPYGTPSFFAVFPIVIFAFTGIELVGMAAGEADDPQRNLPKAINAIPIRLTILYVLAIVAILVVNPWRQIESEHSPFVNMFLMIGVPGAASIVNFIVVTAAISSANSGIFSTGRMMHGLAQKNQAPALFSHLNKAGVPSSGLIFSSLCLSFAVVLLYLDDAMNIFTLVTTVSSICFMFVWSIIVIAYIRYRKVRPDLHPQSNFKMPGGTTMCYVLLSFFGLILVLFAQQQATLHVLEYTPIWFLWLSLMYLLKHKSSWFKRSAK